MSEKYRVPSSGEEWVARKKEEGMVDLEFSRNQRFGYVAVLEWELTNSGQEEACLDNPNMYGKNLTEVKKILPKRLSELSDKLSEASRKSIAEVNDFFYSFLKEADDIAKTAKLLGFDCNTAAHRQQIDLQYLSLIINSTDPQQNEEQIRRKSVAIVASRQLSRACALNSGFRFEKGLRSGVSIEILKFHQKKFVEIEQKKLAQISGFKKKICEFFLQAIENGEFKIKKEVLQERLESLDVLILDGLSASTDEVYGDYRASVHRIRIASNVPDDKLWATYVHESLHALSGAIITEIEFGDLHQIKTGLSLYKNVPNKYFNDDQFLNHGIARSPMLDWLNEAVTEKLTMEIAKEKDGTYEKERKLLELILNKGVDWQIVVDAYFENYRENKTGHATPFLKLFFDEINKKIGKHFLVDLDMCIRLSFDRSEDRKLSVDNTLRLWQEKGDAFIPFIKEEAEKIRKTSGLEE